MVRILIIDDNLIIRHMLKMHIELAKDLKVVGENEIGGHPVDLVEKYSPDVVVVDFDMLGSTARATVEELHLVVPNIPVIATGLHNDQAEIAASKNAGAVDFVVKQADSVALIKAIRRAFGRTRPDTSAKAK